MNYKSFIASLIVVTTITVIPLTASAAVLSKGSMGTEVSNLQTYLIEKGFTIPLIENGVAQKGYFGEQTENAVMMYQESKGLDSTGSIEPSTLGLSGPMRLGGVSTLDGVDFPYTSINGFKEYKYRQTISATSSVFCSIKNPYSATSTLKNYFVNVTANGLGSQTFDVSTSSTAFGTSSPAFVKNFSTGTGQFSTLWSYNATTTGGLLIGLSQGAVGKSDVIIGPTEYVTAKISTSTAGTFGSYFTGGCQGEFVRF